MSDFTFVSINEKELLTEAPENANVLVEVDGAIKRVPRSEVGGAKGYIIPITMDTLNMETAFSGMECTINYDEAYEVLKAGGNVWVDLSVMMASGASTYVGTAGLAPSAISNAMLLVIGWQLTDIGLIVSVLDPYGEPTIVLLPNGSHNVTVENSGK